MSLTPNLPPPTPPKPAPPPPPPSQVIVVDVEGKDDSGWRNLMPFDGGVSGWQLLWDR